VGGAGGGAGVTYEIQTRHPGHPLRAGWTADGIGDGNEFETVAEAEAMIAQFRQSDDPSWRESEYRVVEIAPAKRPLEVQP